MLGIAHVQLCESLFFPTKHPKVRNETGGEFIHQVNILLESKYIYISNPASENSFQREQT